VNDKRRLRARDEQRNSLGGLKLFTEKRRKGKRKKPRHRNKSEQERTIGKIRIVRRVAMVGHGVREMQKQEIDNGANIA
jgi:hypothetical protein